MKIFISAVTSEFGPQRQELSEALVKNGHEVIVQDTFEHRGNSDLLEHILADIRRCGLVLALVGSKPGPATPTQTFIRELARVPLEFGFQQASTTQWEVFLALHYRKLLVPVGPKWIFQDGAPIEDKTQQLLIQRIKESGKRYEVDDVKDLVTKALSQVASETKAERNQAFRKQYPTIARHAESLYDISLARLRQAADTQISDMVPDDWFASRPATSILGPASQKVLPSDIRGEAEAYANKSAPFPEMLLVAKAGDGKTTLINQLLLEFSDVDRVQSRRLVPLFANCVTIAWNFGKMPDAEAIQHWLNIAIVPARNSSRSDTDESFPKVAAFIQELKASGYSPLFLVDGLDELDPAGVNRPEMARRLLDVLKRWTEKSELPSPYFIATTRPNPDLTEKKYAEDDTVREAYKRGLTPYILKTPARNELRHIASRLLTKLGPDSRTPPSGVLTKFIAEFTNEKEINGALVYLPILARYYREHWKELRSVKRAKTPSTTRQALMEFETSSVIQKIHEDLENLTGRPIPIAAITSGLLYMFQEVAIRSLNRKDVDTPGSLARTQLAEFASVKSIPGLEKMMEDEEKKKVVYRLLHFLVYDHRGGEGEHANQFHYRLPHNEHRDYLLADGIFNWINGTNRLMATSELRADLACSYLGTERASRFMDGIVEDKLQNVGSDRRRDFALQLVELINSPERFPSRWPAERTEASPHGAMLSLLLSLGRLPWKEGEKVDAAGLSFQRVRASAPSEEGELIALPVKNNCKNAIFREAKLHGVDLSGLALEDCDFDNAELHGANLTNAVLTAANLRNVAMGRFNELPTMLTSTQMDRADLFNYRFQGLKGYYYFWDLEVAGSDDEPERYILAASSRGQILAFDLGPESSIDPVVVQTASLKPNEVMDLSRHPVHRDIVVITGRDCSVRVLKLPQGSPSDWTSQTDPDGFPYVKFVEVGVREDLAEVFNNNYPRRAQFSASGDWLAVTARDERVAFFKVTLRAGRYILEGPIYGRDHEGPVMCVVADREPGTRDDRFFTAGYDGRVALWRQGPESADKWKRARGISTPLKVGSEKHEKEIFRALSPSATGKGLWAGTELHGALYLYQFKGHGAGVEVTEKRVRKFEEGVFAIATHSELLAVGLAAGRVMVFRSKGGDEYDWDNPVMDLPTNGEIVRSLQFVRDGKHLLAATWDACLFRFDVDAEKVIAKFEFPSSQWKPALDVGQIQFDGDPLADAIGVSSRMKEYLKLVQEARNGG